MYEEYAKAVNKIFSIVDELSSISDQENENYLTSIRELKDVIISYADIVKSGNAGAKVVKDGEVHD